MYQICELPVLAYRYWSHLTLVEIMFCTNIDILMHFFFIRMALCPWIGWLINFLMISLSNLIFDELNPLISWYGFANQNDDNKPVQLIALRKSLLLKQNKVLVRPVHWVATITLFIDHLIDWFSSNWHSTLDLMKRNRLVLNLIARSQALKLC